MAKRQKRMFPPKASAVLLCLSLSEQRQGEIYDRLTVSGHTLRPSQLQQVLDTLTSDGLVVTRRGWRGAYVYRLAEGEAVEVALNEAWANAEAEQSHRE
jgi:DNA-binding PadR family transcriptional regulator